MAIAGIPQNFYLQTANAQILLSWDQVAGATSYQVQRSTDGITFANYATSVSLQYLDLTVTEGTQYWYQIASINGSGTGSFTQPQSAVPVQTGEMCLSQIRLQAQQRADRVNSQFVTKPEWNTYINQSLFELYDLLITNYEDYFVAPPVTFSVVQNQYLYDLPNGKNYSGAPSFYKLMGVDLALNTANNAFVTVNRFDFIDRNNFVYPNTASTIYGVFNLRYRLVGSQIEFIPTPSANQNIRLWYIPRLTQLLLDTDTTSAGISGWIEYVITDAAIKALQKEESDVSVLQAQKMALIKRIEDSAMNRDVGQADTISDVRTVKGWNGSMGGWGNMSGGW